jgi:predicted transcriptional regulator
MCVCFGVDFCGVGLYNAVVKRKQILIPKWLDECLSELSKDNHLSYSDLVRVSCCILCKDRHNYINKNFESHKEAKQFVEDLTFHARENVEKKRKAHHC